MLEIDEKSLESVIISKKPVLVFFHSNKNMESQFLDKFIDDIRKKFDNLFVKINIDKYPLIIKKFLIQSTPCIIIFKLGQEIDRIIGYKAKDDLIIELRNKIVNV